MDFFFDLENPLTSFVENQSDTVPSMFADESVLVLPNFPANFRHEALMLISKFYENLDPLVSYLAVNYMDHFISAEKLTNQEKPCMVGLVAISCVSLAVKMKNLDVSIPNLQLGYKFDAKSIGRMEILILTSLKWRMRSITPFSFLYYLLSLYKLQDSCLSLAIKDRAFKIILKSPYELKFLEFGPSVIAASALLHASQDLIPLEYSCFRAAIFSCKYLNKESVDECSRIMQDMMSNINQSISVLDYQCTSSKGENSTSIKRRRLYGVFHNEHCTSRLSEAQHR